MQQRHNTWAKQLDTSLTFGYFINDKIVGSCKLSIEKIAKISHTGTLFGMYVKDDCRAGGIGLALVNFVKDYAKKIISWDCCITNLVYFICHFWYKFQLFLA